MDDLGAYSKGFITNVPADLSTDFANEFREKTYKYPLEGIYIYSFEEGKMLYADGWEEVCGVPDSEINMLAIVNFTAPAFSPFVNEINDKALKFLHQRNQKLTEYSFTIELKILHRNGKEVPVTAKVSVFEAAKDGRLKSIIGRFQVDYGLKFGKVMRYAAYGPEKDAFETDLNESLFYPYHISQKEMEALRLLADGFAYKEMAEKLDLSQSAVEKRIRPLFQRFNVKNNAHLIAFAFQNNLLP
jgi:DNA-binding CsgD family transcriptional regulator